MASWQGLHNEAQDAYWAHRMRDAALLWRRAAAAAREIGDEVGWYKTTFWAADASLLGGDPPAALALLLDARQREPADAPVLEAWFARQRRFDIVLDTAPERTRLADLLTDLRTYAAGRAVSADDLAVKEAKYLEAIGDWPQALAAFETAWERHDGRGSLKSWRAYQAAALCLRLDRPDACRDWIEVMVRAGDDAHAVVALHQTQRRIDLALATAYPGPNQATECKALLRTLTDRTLAVDSDDAAAELRDYAVRVQLLDLAPGPDGDDPADPLHPARAELRRRHPGRYNVHGRFDARLLFLDYRLACLRFAAGLPPRDDKYHRHPDDLSRLGPETGRRADKRSASAATPDLATRLHKARTAANWAMAYAKKLDTLLQCDWRQAEVAQRRDRIEAIANAVGSAPASAAPGAQRPRVR